MKPNYWIGVGAAFCVGVIAGVAGTRVELENRLRKEFEEQMEMMQHAYEQALDLQRQQQETPVENEIDLDGGLDEAIKSMDAQIESEPKAFGEGVLTEGGEIEKVKDNPYHQAVAHTVIPTSTELFVDGGVNDYGVSYIDEEEYEDEDGRFKGKIDLIMDDHEPIFMMDGQRIDDWDKRLGDSILVDFYKLAPPGAEPILYVRNHRTDEDYEVVRVTP